MNCTSGPCEETASKMIGVCLMVIVTFMAIFGNIFIIIAILQSQKLRTKLCHFFVLNLAFTDLISALVILPISITVFILGYWPWSLQVCVINGCLNSLLVFASILNLCLISMERFYAIRFTMHHAAHMTLPRTLIAIGTSWLCSAIVAILPFTGLTFYEFRGSKSNCSYTLETVGYEKLFLVLVTVLCFLMPGCIILVMYSGIYRVAHQLSTQVHPVPQNQCWRNGPSIIAVSHIEHEQQREQNCDANGNEKMEANFRSIQIPNIKAAKSFILIILSYMLLWGPYFGLHMYGAVHGVLPSGHYLEVLVTWLGYLSFAVNPLIYGWMNSCIRDELVLCLRRVCRVKDPEDTDVNRPVTIPEDFYEFLHRTRDDEDTIKTNDIKLKSKTKSQYVDIEVTDTCTINEPYF